MNRTCAKCSKPMVTQVRWRAVPVEQRRKWAAEGIGTHRGHGLCTPCYCKDRYFPTPKHGPEKCTDCDVRMIPRGVWAETSKADRVGVAEHGARGLCARCYRQAFLKGTLAEYDKTVIPLDELMEEWELLRQPGVPLVRQMQHVAPRLGMTPGALERRLRRAGVTSEFTDGGHTHKATVR